MFKIINFHKRVWGWRDAEKVYENYESKQAYVLKNGYRYANYSMGWYYIRGRSYDTVSKLYNGKYHLVEVKYITKAEKYISKLGIGKIIKLFRLNTIRQMIFDYEAIANNLDIEFRHTIVDSNNYKIEWVIINSKGKGFVFDISKELNDIFWEIMW